MEKLVDTKKGVERNKRLHRRRTFHGSTQQTETPQRSHSGITDNAGGILTKTPVTRPCSVRKPLQVVSATKGSSNCPFFNSTRKDKSISITKLFGTKAMEPVVKSKIPVAFTTPKPQGISSFNLPCGKLDSAEGCNSDVRQFSQGLGSSSDDLRKSYDDGEKPFLLQSLLSSRKSKKLDFIIKDSKNSKTGVMKSKQDRPASASSAPLIARSSASSSTITKLSLPSSTNPKSSASSMVAESAVSPEIAKSSSLSSTNQSSLSSVVTASASSMITKSSSSSAMMISSSIKTKSSISSCTVTSCTSSKRMRVDEKTNMGTALDLPAMTSKVDENPCKQSSIKQEASHAVQDEAHEDDEFSNSVFSGNMVKRDPKALSKNVESNWSRDQDPSVCPSEKQNRNEEKPERKKLKVSRKSAKSSSRKALQEARLQGLKKNFKNSTQDFEIGCNISLTPSPPEAAELLPSSVSETEISCNQKSTPSPTGNIDKSCVSKSDTQSPSSSTSSSVGLESSTKTYKDWMHLFEEPYPRRSPRLSSLPSSTAKDFEYLMDNFSPLTSRMRSKGRKKQSRGRSSQEINTKEEDANIQSEASKEVNIPVSPLVLAEEQTSKRSASENDGKKKEESLKRPKKEKPDKTIKTKKNLNVNLIQPVESDSRAPSSTGQDVLEDNLFHFPRPSADLSCPGGPYSMIVDFALPDKDFAKLKLTKIKGNQGRKKATKEYEGMPSHCDLKEKQKLSENLVTDRKQGHESVEVDKDSTVNDDGLANLATNSGDSKVNIKETGGVEDERETHAIPKDITDKNESQGQEKDALHCEIEDNNTFIPVIQNTKTGLSITTDNETSDNLSDSENTLSGSILQNLQVKSSNVDNNSKPEKIQDMDDLVTHGPESSEIPVEKRSPEMLKMSSLCLQNKPKHTRKSSKNRGRSNLLEEYENSVENEVKGNEKGIKREKIPPGKECVPSSQGSSASQSPNDLKGLLFLNGSVKKKSHPIPDSTHLLSLEEQQQEQQAGSDTLDDSENTSIPSENPLETVTLQSKSEVEVIQHSIEEHVEKIGEDFPQKHKDNKLVIGGLETMSICGDKEGLLGEKKSNLGHVNDVTGHVSNNDSKTTQVLPCRSENDIERVSAVNQITVSQPGFDKTLSFSLGDTEMDSPVNQVAESHCSLESVPSSFLHDTEMGSIVDQECRNLEFVQTPDRNIKNPLHGVTAALCSNTEEFDDNTPGSIKGSLPLYSNPEECNEQTTVPDGSFPLCSATEEFSHTVDAPIDQNTEEFCIAELESLEPSIGDTATPHGKACVPQGSSVMEIESGHTESDILTPVLMQACLQHDNSDSTEVLSISMSTYDIPGHVVKKRDVIAVCLSHWVVLWIKNTGQEWTVLKSWTLDNTDPERFQMVKFLPVASYLVLFVGGTFPSANGRVYGYSENTSYDFQLEYEDIDDLMSYSAMCVLNDKEQCTNSNDSDVELVVAGATENQPVVIKWSLDCHCLFVKEHQELTLPYSSGAITSLCTVDGNHHLLVGSTGTHLLLWNSKHCDLLKEITLSSPGLHNFDCLQVATEMGLLFLTMCPRSAAQKEFVSNGSPCLLYALNPRNNNFKCLKSFPFQELATSSPRCSSVCGQYLALGHQDGVACLVNMAASQHLATFPVFQGAIESISFHPNRPVIAFGGGKNACVHVYSLS